MNSATSIAGEGGTSVKAPATPATASTQPQPAAEPKPAAPKAPPHVSEPVNDESRLKLREQLENLQVETMFDMVKQVEFPMGEGTTTCNFLYLTNQQAARFTMKNMPQLRKELDLGNPKLVIRLMPSFFGQAWWNSFPFFHGRFPSKRVPEEEDKDRIAAEHQLLLLAKEVILPQAMATNALILGQESCALTSAFLKVIGPLQAQLRDRCPFRLLIFTRAQMFEMEARSQNSIIHHFRDQCPAWKEKKTIFDDALARRYGHDMAFWPRSDLQQGAYSVVMFECLTGKNIADQTSTNFQNDFITDLMTVPVIALSTYGTEYMNVSAMSEHISRGMPLLLIDSRKRTPPDQIEDTKAELHKISEGLHKAQNRNGSDGVADWYTTSLISYVKAVIDNKRSEDRKLSKSTKDKDLHDTNQADLSIWQAITDLTPKKLESETENQASKHEKAASDDAIFVQGADAIMKFIGAEYEWEMTSRQDRFKEAFKSLQETQSWSDFQKTLEDKWLQIRGCCFHFFFGLEKFCVSHKWAKLVDNGERPSKKWMKGRKYLSIKYEDVAHLQDLEEAKAELLELFEKEYEVSSEMDNKKLTQKAFYQQEYKWLAVYDLMKADNVHTSSLHNLSSCKRTLSKIAKIDYLPTANTLEQLVVLRRAWTFYDIFQSEADRYRTLSKWGYLSMLIIGGLTIWVVTLKDLFPHHMPSNWLVMSQNIVLALSLFGSLVAGLITMCEPSRKWLALRAAALAIESEVWKFRTRMGEYVGDPSISVLGRGEAERNAANTLSRHLIRLQERVGGSGLKRTSFYSVATTATIELGEKVIQSATNAGSNNNTSGLEPHLQVRAYIRHGQFDTKGSSSTAQTGGCRCPCRRRSNEVEEMCVSTDNHHSPTLPEEYIKRRLVPARDYYQAKIPGYYKNYRCFQVFILFASIFSALIASTSISTLNAMLASLTSMVAAWQEFTTVEKKLERTSSVAAQLERLLLWWQAIPTEEKGMMENIENLVMTSEGCIAGLSAATLSETGAVAKKVAGEAQSVATKED